MEIYVPFSNTLELYFEKVDDPRIRLQKPVEDWLAEKGWSPEWIMNNPWEAIFDFEDLDQAMLFKLTWA